MKKLALFLALLTLPVVFSVAASAAPRTTPAPPTEGMESISFAGLEKMTVDEFLALTPRKIKQQTGEKLSLKEAIALKAAQKKVKKQLKKGGLVDGGKSQLVALILVVLVGALGIHRFYLGYTGIGIIQLLTLGGCGIWALIDMIRIITGDLEPKDGPYEETL